MRHKLVGNKHTHRAVSFLCIQACHVRENDAQNGMRKHARVCGFNNSIETNCLYNRLDFRNSSVNEFVL